jgi:pimeloyl-ACP methyl ester carboxylesterase
MAFASVTGGRIEYERIPGGDRGPEIVMLHEGLGSISMWRDFPRQVAAATRQDVLVYSRHGYGRSAPVRAPRPVRFMHHEALMVLPELLDVLGVRRPLLLGHSDGGSIAIIHAGGSGREVAGLILLAPHVMVEELSVTSIAAAGAAYERGDLRSRLSRHHDDVDGAFRGWNDVWLSPAFREWSIEEYLPALTCPVLAIQGEADEYGTMEQIDRIAGAAPDVELLKLPGAGHSPHRDRPREVLAAVTRFAARAR